MLAEVELILYFDYIASDTKYFLYCVLNAIIFNYHSKLLVTSYKVIIFDLHFYKIQHMY